MSVSEFFRSIRWVDTLKIASIRILLASVLWTALFLFSGGATLAEFIPRIVATFALLVIFMAIAIPATALARAQVPWVGLLALPAWAAVVGDPLVKIIHEKYSNLIPVDEFKYFNPPVLAVFGTN